MQVNIAPHRNATHASLIVIKTNVQHSTDGTHITGNVTTGEFRYTRRPQLMDFHLELTFGNMLAPWSDIQELMSKFARMTKLLSQNDINVKHA